MPFRDDDEALRARNQALAQELADRERKLEETKEALEESKRDQEREHREAEREAIERGADEAEREKQRLQDALRPKKHGHVPRSAETEDAWSDPGWRGDAQHCAKAARRSGRGARSTSERAGGRLMRTLRALPKRLLLIPLIAGVGYYSYWFSFAPPSADTPASEVLDVCPLRADSPLVLIDQILAHRQGRSFSYDDHYTYLSILDPRTGTLRSRSYLDEAHSGDCIGLSDSVVWLRTREAGLHARDLATGEIVVTRAEIEALLPAPIRGHDFSMSHGYLRVPSADGRSYYIQATPRLTMVDDITAALADESTANDGEVPLGLRAHWAGVTQRNGRARITFDGEPAAGRSFLEPHFLTCPGVDGRIWPDLDSVVVVEETSLDSDIYRVVRLGTDATLQWEHTPNAPASDAARWLVSPNGEALYYFTKAAEVIAIDVSDGRQRFRVQL